MKAAILDRRARLAALRQELVAELVSIGDDPATLERLDLAELSYRRDRSWIALTKSRSEPARNASGRRRT